jgi:cyclopropane-fatty-acyl-phospholipid synthase
VSEVIEATNRHYNIDPRMFALFLDPWRKYTCALFGSDGETLDVAQERKLEFIVDQLRLGPGRQLLDVGCGWGSLALFAALRRGCKVTAVTPAVGQVEFIRNRAAELGVADRVVVMHGPFEEVDLPSGRFDAVSLVGSINHIADKGRCVRGCYDVLRPGGRFYLSDSCFRNRVALEEFGSRPGTAYVLGDFFGWAALPPVSDYVRHIEEAGLTLIELRDLTAHYARTIDAWRENLLARRDEAERLVPGLADRFVRFFDVANAGWGFSTRHYALTAVRGRALTLGEES